MLTRRNLLKTIALGSAVLVSSQALPAVALTAGKTQSGDVAIDFAGATPQGLPRYLVISNPSAQDITRAPIRINARFLDQAGLLAGSAAVTPVLGVDQGAPGVDSAAVRTFLLPETVRANSTAVFELTWLGHGVPVGLRVLATLQVNYAVDSYSEVYTQEFIVGQVFNSSLSAVIPPVGSRPASRPAPEPQPEPESKPGFGVGSSSGGGLGSKPEPVPEPAPAPAPEHKPRKRRRRPGRNHKPHRKPKPGGRPRWPWDLPF